MNGLLKRNSVRRAVGGLWRAGCDFLYPPACPICAAPIERSAESRETHRFCKGCQRDIQPDDLDACRRCGAPVGPYLDVHSGCGHCRDERFAFDSVIRFGVYEGLLQRACLMMKQRNGVSLAYGLVNRLWAMREEELRNVSAAVVTAVPRHWTGVFQRKHHAAETLGKALAKRLSLPFRDDPLRKVRRTPRQLSLMPTKRRTNLRGAFSAELSDDLQGTTLLLVDDVLTTGSTANEASKALRKAGAARVVVAIIARGLGK